MSGGRTGSGAGRREGGGGGAGARKHVGIAGHVTFEYTSDVLLLEYVTFPPQ